MPTSNFASASGRNSLLLLLLLAGFIASSAPVIAAEKCPSGSCQSCQDAACCCEERHDDVWCLSTRCAPYCINDQEAASPTIVFRRIDAETGNWREATAEEFFGGEDATLPTTFWVHGDRIEDEDVYDVGMAVYDRLVKCQPVGRIRYVIWSWPASVSYMLRPIKDAKLKGQNGLQDGYRLGWVLARLPGQTPVKMIGYSAAGRIIFGALHGMGGGMVAGHGLLDEQQLPGPPRYSVVTFATAVDNFWLEPEQCFGLAMSQMERLLLLNNHCDMILQHYPKLCGTDALGYTGLANPMALGEDLDRVEQVNVCCMIGKQHRWKNYVYSDTVMPMIQEYALPSYNSNTNGHGDPAPTPVADGGDVEMVDGLVVVVEDLDGRPDSALAMFADAGDVEVVDGVLVVIEDAYGLDASSIVDATPEEAVETVSHNEERRGYESASTRNVFVEAAHRSAR